MHGTTRRFFAVSSAGLLLLAGACSPNPSAESGGSGPGSANAAGEVAKDAGPVEVHLAEFTITPKEIAGAAGQPTTINVTNDGTAPHSLVVDAGGTEVKTEEIAAGGTATLEVPALDAGSYDVWCGVPGHKEAGMTATLVVSAGGTDAGSSGDAMSMDSMTAEEMMAGHKKGVEDFVANISDPITEGLGAQPLKPTMEGRTKVFDLSVDAGQWEVAPGDVKDVWTYNGTIPGPQIEVHSGDHIRIHVTNNIEQPTVLHLHGVNVPNAMDGVPFITQDPIMPGDSFDYEFTVKNEPGLYLYHSHFNSDEQVQHGLFGPFLVVPKGQPLADVEQTMIIGDGYLGYNLSGKSFPATSAIIAKKNDTVLLHLANIGSIIHPMHLHGYDFTVVAQDGQPLDSPYEANTLMIAPGNTYDVVLHATKKGIWAFHCHILSHVEGPGGMFGMVTALVVQ